MSNEQTAPSDVVIIILSLLGEGKNIPSSSSNNFLHDRFYELSQSFPALFQDYVFNISSIYPRRETIEIAINRITKFGLVEWRSEGNYIVLPALVSKGKKLMELFSATDRIKLSKAAEKFAKMTEDYYKKCNCER